MHTADFCCDGYDAGAGSTRDAGSSRQNAASAAPNASSAVNAFKVWTMARFSPV